LLLIFKKKLNFQGLVITDALEMKGVSNTYKDGNAELKALLAGNDMLILPQDIPQALKKIKEAIDSSK